jgi:hypothetical protein
MGAERRNGRAIAQRGPREGGRQCFLVTALLAVSALTPSPARADGGFDPADFETEIGLVPLVGGDSDVGFGGGELSSVTRSAPG